MCINSKLCQGSGGSVCVTTSVPAGVHEEGLTSSATSAKWPCAIPDLDVRQFSTCDAAVLTLGSRPHALFRALASAVSLSP